MKATTKGIAKVGLSLLVLTFLAVFAYSYVFPALAANISDVTISPVYTKCDSNNVYTVNVTNNGPDPVTIVELYNGTYGGVMPNIPPHTNYTCGLAPTGWVLTDLHPSGIPYCQYNAQNSSYYINAGASKTFTFSAIRTAESNYSWGVVTRDSVLAWASHYPASIADCSPPTTVKSFSGPQYPQDNDFWGSPHWISTLTNVTLTAVDNPLSHPVGMNATYWRNTLVDDYYCYNPQSCAQAQVDGGGSATINFTATEDSYVKETAESAGANFGTANPIFVTSEDGSFPFKNDRSFVKFNISSIPSNAIINSARLRMFEDDAPSSNRTHQVHRVTGNWNESGITWNNQPSVDGLTATNMTGTTNDVYISWNVASDVQGFVDGTFTNYGWRIRDSVENATPKKETKYKSREDSNAAKRPTLIISYTLPGSGFNTYNGTFHKNEESCHLIEYYSVDKLNNTEPVKKQCVFVDNTPPEGSKLVGEPSIPLDDDVFDYFVSMNTPITLDCVDEGNHPVDHNTVYWRFSTSADGQTFVPGQWQSSDQLPKTIYFPEDSYHDLEYYCADAVGNTNQIDTEYFIVDTVAPVINKTIIGPQYGTCPPQSENDDCYIADHNTIINVSAYDPQPHPSDDVKCEWSYTVNGQPVEGGSYGWINPPFEIVFPEDSTHMLTISCKDALGNTNTDVETFLVDSIPPETVKTYGEPFVNDWYPKGCNYDNGFGPQCAGGGCNNYCSWAEWINSSTPVTLSATDEKVGVNKTYWRNLLVEDSEAGENICGNSYYCNPDYYNNYVNLSTPWNVYVNPFQKPEESCHVIEYYSVDKLGNTEEMKWQCAFVDNTPPATNKTIGEPKVIKTTGGVTTCTNQSNGGGSNGGPLNLTGAGTYVATVNFSTKCSSGTGVGIAYDGQNLWYSCYASTTDLYRADPATGIVTASYNIAGGLGALAYDATRNAIWLGYGDSGKKIRLAHLNSTKDITSTTEEFVAAVGGIALDDGLAYDASDDTLYISPDIDPTITQFNTTGGFIRSFPKAPGSACGNSGLAIGGSLLYEGFNGCNQVIVVNKTNTSVPIFNFSTTQSGDPAFRDEDLECDTNTFASQGKQVMWSVEAYDNPEERRALAFQIPFGSCGIGGQPAQNCTTTGANTTVYITQNTPITLSCKDSQPHPVDHVALWYRYRFNESCNNLGDSEWTEWIDPADPYMLEKTIYFKQDSCHELEYYCTDGLGNAEPVKREIDIVDTQPPVITKTIVGPKWGNCLPQNEGDKCYIDGATNISVTVEDPQPHPVGDVVCRWGYTVDGGDFIIGGQGLGTSFNVHFPEESSHELRIECRDGLGNKVSDVETFLVDKTPPVTRKYFEGPQYPENNDGYGSHWISNNTNIILSVDDDGPHKSGVNATYWRNTLVDDSFCTKPYHNDYDNGDNGNGNGYDDPCVNAIGSGQWNLYTGPFNKTEQSCHLIEYYSVDNVNKTEIMKKQCVFVDNTAPLPNKTVGKPVEMWDGTTNGMDSIYYPGLKNRCWNSSSSSNIDCWKVTTLTPITLSCTDQQPHPVDHSTISFNVNFDGSDSTPEYCDEFEGQVGEDGYCAVQQEAPITFLFGEESEHNLAFYCTDALGNNGPVDDEKFKVEGTSFNITINNKWNLISVPFVLLNDSIHKVFDPEADKIKSVWSYDAASGNWSIFTPDGNNGNDNLNSMLPGSGYWVLAKNDTSLLIGGSLFSPAKTPPSKQIVSGWNLIGYWGTEGETSYNGPNGNGKKASCEIGSLAATEGDIVFNSLWSYWEPYNPDQWIKFGKNKHMDPGAGYWVFTNQNGEFVIPTTC